MAQIKIKKQAPFPRGYGILLPLFSLPGPHGIGTMGQPCFEFLNFLSRAKAGYWQLLPLGPTGYGDSPYQSFSSFAGNPYFINPLLLQQQGKLTAEEAEAARAEAGKISYGDLWQNRPPLLQKAFTRAQNMPLPHFKSFFAHNRYWLEDYAAYSALKSRFGNVARSALPYPVKTPEALDFVQKNLKNEFNYYCYIQYEFHCQWQAVKEYAAQKNILLIGDLPLYPADDSADVWANPELFCLNKSGQVTEVAGVPPDAFAKNGQRWGNPLYCWPAHEAQNFSWWIQRIKRQFEFYDILRLDHFIGFSNYYSIPAACQQATAGKWLNAPGKKLFFALQNAMPQGCYIAEDLGPVTKATKALLKATGFPGMRLLQAGFSGPNNPNLPHRLTPNCTVYTGTHDNETLLGHILAMSAAEKQLAYRYFGVKHRADLPERIIRAGFASVANLFVLPLQDLLQLPNSARINTPGTVAQNWSFRLKELPSNLLADETAALARIFERSNEKNE